jgi:hypothetical protein
MLLTCLALAASLLLTRVYDDARRREVVLYGVLCAAMVYTHLFGLFVLAFHAAWLGIETTSGALPWRRMQPWGLALVAGLATLIPWLGILAMQADRFAASPWYVAPSPDSLGYLWLELAGSFTGPAAALLLGIGLMLARPPRDGRGVTFLVAAVAGLMFVPQTLSYLAAPVLRDRNVLPLLPILILAAGAGFARIRPSRAAVTVSAAVALLFTMVTVRTVFGEPRLEQWREAADQVRAGWRPGDVVVANHGVLWQHYLKPPIDVLEPPSTVAPDQTVAWIHQQRKDVKRVWILHGHTLEPFPQIDAIPRGRTVLLDRPLVGARVVLVDLAPLAIDLKTLTVPDPSMIDATGLHFWWNASARTAPLTPPSTHRCAIGVKGSSESAGGIPAKLALRFVVNDASIAETRVDLPEQPGMVLGEAADVPSPVQIEVAFVNDGEAVTPAGTKEDRNADIEQLFVRCGG